MKEFKNKIISLIKAIGSNLLFLKRKEIDRDNVQKILVNSLYFIGDTIFHTPVFEALRHMFPNAEIDLWVKSRCYEVVKNNPAIDNIIVFDNVKTADYNEVASYSIVEKIRFLRGIRKKKYDLYIDLTGKYTTAMIALFGNFRYSSGINYHGFGFCYNKYFDLDTSNSPGHLIDKYLSVVRSIFSLNEQEWESLRSVIRASPYLYVDENAINEVNRELNKRDISVVKPIICIHTTAGWKAKEMDSGKFAELIDSIVSQNKYDFLIVGDQKDESKVKEIQQYLKSKINLLDIFVSLSLTGTIELIKRADLLIGSDSAPLHIAGAVNTPSIALFGPTNPNFSKPRGEKSMVVYQELYCSASANEQFCTRNAGKTCPTIDCMKNIEVMEILKKIEILLNPEKIQYENHYPAVN